MIIPLEHICSHTEHTLYMDEKCGPAFVAMLEAAGFVVDVQATNRLGYKVTVKDKPAVVNSIA